MKLIQSYTGPLIQVDDNDYEWLNQYKWYIKKSKSTSYAERYAGNKKYIKMHREILQLKEGEIGDHKDHNGLNNQRENLRIATKSQNCANRKKMKHGKTSKYIGVSKLRNGWQVQCTHIESRDRKFTIRW